MKFLIAFIIYISFGMLLSLRISKIAHSGILTGKEKDLFLKNELRLVFVFTLFWLPLSIIFTIMGRKK